MEGIALLVAIGLAAAGGRASARAPQSVEPEPDLSLTRPRVGGTLPPSGQDARDLRTYDGLIDHPGYAVTPQGVLATFRMAEQGNPQRQCDLFDDLIENDGHLRNLFEQREQAVAGKPWVIQPGGNAPSEELGARILGVALARLPMVQIFQHLLSVNRFGWSACELDWGLVEVDGKKWIAPTWIQPVPARRFRIATGTNGIAGSIDELRLFVDYSRPYGDELRPDKWITLRRSSTWLARCALMRTASWFAMAKRYGFRDWLIYSQRFGLPLPIVTYDDTNGVDDAQMATAEDIIRNIGSDGGAIKPKSLELDFHDATRGNNENSKAHGGLIAHCNAEMSKLINGSTLSNDNAGSGGASYALGEVHASTRWDNVLFDTELLQEGIRTQIGAALMRFNGLAGAAPLARVQVVRDLDPKSRAEIAVSLKNFLGMELSQSQLYQELGFRPPLDATDAAPGPATPITPAPGKAAA